jgi:CRISPR-associated protein Csm2
VTQQQNWVSGGERLANQLVTKDLLQKIITEQSSEATKALVSSAEVIGKRLAAGVTTSQIRNIFGTVRMIEQEVQALAESDPLPISVQRSLQMLRPKLAYQYGRVQGNDDNPKKVAMGALVTILSEAISLVGSSVPNFRNFMDFFEAILAYHRYAGGKTNG